MSATQKAVHEEVRKSGFGGGEEVLRNMMSLNLVGRDLAATAQARHKNLAGLPSTYVDIGNLDLFRDEVIYYVARISAENVDVEFHLVPGAPHTFDYAFSTSVAKQARRARVKALQSF